MKLDRNTYTPAKANPVILLPFIRSAPSLTVSFFYYRDDKAKPCYSHYVYDLNAETENCDEVCNRRELIEINMGTGE
ncbi:hypothetical protein YC2023_099837 [Brassica napus]